MLKNLLFVGTVGTVALATEEVLKSFLTEVSVTEKSANSSAPPPAAVPVPTLTAQFTNAAPPPMIPAKVNATAEVLFSENDSPMSKYARNMPMLRSNSEKEDKKEEEGMDVKESSEEMGVLHHIPTNNRRIDDSALMKTEGSNFLEHEEGCQCAECTGVSQHPEGCECAECLGASKHPDGCKCAECCGIAEHGEGCQCAECMGMSEHGENCQCAECLGLSEHGENCECAECLGLRNHEEGCKCGRCGEIGLRKRLFGFEGDLMDEKPGMMGAWRKWGHEEREHRGWGCEGEECEHERHGKEKYSEEDWNWLQRERTQYRNFMRKFSKDPMYYEAMYWFKRAESWGPIYE